MKLYVENLPQTCEYCDCCHTREYDSRLKIDGIKFCGVENEDVENYYYHGNGRPSWCPLKKIPEKFLKQEYNDFDCGFNISWNECVDEMIE